MFCPKCGSKIDGNSEYCNICGAAIKVRDRQWNEQAKIPAVSAGSQQTTLYIVFALLAANVFTAFTAFFKIFSIPLSVDRIFETGEISSPSFSFTFLFKQVVGFTRRIADSWVRYGSTQKGYYWYVLFGFMVYAAAIAGVVFIVLAVKELFGSDKERANEKILRRLCVSTITALAQLVLLLIFKFIIDENETLSFSAWFYVLFIAAGATLFAEIFILKQKN